MHLRHLVISSLAALAVGGMVQPLTAAEAADTDSGQILTLETTDKPLETVLQWISRRAGVNVVCNETDPPRVTMRLANVTWQEAVDQIAQRYDFVVVKKSDRLWELTKPPKVRMQFEDARLSVVLSAIANQAGVNIVISDDVNADRRITMTLHGVPWREALDVIVKAMGYAWVEQPQYNIVRVVDVKNVQKDLSTEIFRLNYQDATGLAKVLTELGGKDAVDAKVVVDVRSNSLVVTATPPALASMRKTIHELDARTREVQIEMKFVEFSNQDAQRLGFNPSNVTFNLKDVGRFSPTFSPFNDNFGGGLGYNTRFAPSTSADKATGLYPLLSQPASTGMGGVPTNNGSFSSDFAFEALSILASSEILQAPQLLTLDNTEAVIEIGREIHFAESTISESGGVGTQQVTLKEAQGSPVTDGIKIAITPHITSDGFISIKLEAKNDKATLQLFTNGKQTTDPYFNSIQLPQKDSTKLKNTFMVADGRTAVIGGLLSNTATEETRQIPVLGSIPVLGWFFKKQNDNVSQRNLTVFITPHIIPLNEEKSEYEQGLTRLREKLYGLGAKPAQPQQEQEQDKSKGKNTGPE